MEPMGVNYWAVLVAGLVYWVLGAIWYAAPVFGNTWMAGIGKTKEQVEANYTPIKLVWALVANLVQAYGLARIFAYMNVGTAMHAIIGSLIVSTCIVLPIVGINDIMESRTMKLSAVNIFYVIVGFFIMSIILWAWR